jgi:hypothetical protein
MQKCKPLVPHGVVVTTLLLLTTLALGSAYVIKIVAAGN